MVRLPRLPKFVPRHEFLKDRQRQRMRDLRFQRQLQFQSRFPIRFSRKDRQPSLPAKPPPFNWLQFLRERYGFFPMFKKLPIVSPRGVLEGWSFYRDRYEWGRDFIYLVRMLQRKGF